MTQRGETHNRETAQHINRKQATLRNTREREKEKESENKGGERGKVTKTRRWDAKQRRANQNREIYENPKRSQIIHREKKNRKRRMRRKKEKERRK